VLSGVCRVGVRQHVWDVSSGVPGATIIEASLSVKGVLQVADLSRLQNNALCLMLGSVQDSSRITYSSGVKRWFKFCEQIKCDPFLRIEHPSFLDGGQLFEFKEGIVASFISWLFLDEKITPGTINTYLSGVRYMWCAVGTDVSFLKSVVIANIKTSISLRYRLSVSVASRRRLPVTVDFWFSLLTVCLVPVCQSMISSLLLAF
jgi:hypothetical protein